MRDGVLMKGQLHQMETIAILFVFFILVALGVVFFTKVAASNIQKDVEKFQELSKIQIAQIASSLPELQCSQDNVVRPNCVDTLKAETVQLGTEYFDLFAYSTITVEQIFPAGSGNKHIIYDKQPNEMKSKLTSYFPISMYDARDNNYYFGVMLIEVYS